MTTMGLNLTNDKSKKKKKISKQRIYVIGMSEYGGLSPDEGISLLQSQLSVGTVDKVLGPVKETGSAGKSLMDWGRQWISKLIHSN
jgi:transposase